MFFNKIYLISISTAQVEEHRKRKTMEVIISQIRRTSECIELSARRQRSDIKKKKMSK
jgi:hypothetical protein